MISCRVENVKSFMHALLIGNLMDAWNVREVKLSTRVSYTIDGHLNPAFLSEGETSELALWEELKPVAAALVRGKKSPSLFHIIVSLPSSALTDIESDPEDQFLLNIHYENGNLTLITAMSHKTFTMDRTADNAWDTYIPAYFKAHGIELSASL